MTSFIDIDPTTEETIDVMESSSSKQVQSAVKSARDAQRQWAAMPHGMRAERLLLGGKSLADRAVELAHTVNKEMGKPYNDAYGESFGWSMSIPSKMEDAKKAIETILVEGTESDTTILREPHGVVAAITPWNFPVGMPIELVVPALAVGNTVVFKPSELVPKTGAIIHECFSQHLPDGVFNLVQGDGKVGADLVGGDVDFVSFIGSMHTGQAIMKQAAQRVTPVLLELGGKDPMFVFEDADLVPAAEICVRESFRNAGQICNSIERVYVAAPIKVRFEALIRSIASEWSCGKDEDSATRIGPIVSLAGRDKIVAQVSDAVENGARLIIGGYVPEGPGYFYPPTFLMDVPLDATVMTEETFGPVLSVAEFSGDEQEAISLANATDYGLCATIFTDDMDRAHRIAREIKCGQIGINRYLGDGSGVPWVGRKRSGVGFLCGVEGARQLTVPKSISIPTTQAETEQNND